MLAGLTVPPPCPLSHVCFPEKLVSKKPQVVYDEMDVLKKLDSPHIVKIYDWFEVSLWPPLQKCLHLLGTELQRH